MAQEWHSQADAEARGFFHHESKNQELIEDLQNFLVKHDEELLTRFSYRINREVEEIMAAVDDAKAALSALVAEDGKVVAGLNDLAAKVANGSSIQASDVQAITDGIKAEVARVDAALNADDPAPAPAPPVVNPTPAPVDPTPVPAPVDPTPTP